MGMKSIYGYEGRLRGLQSEMAEDRHPIVQLGAGSAAVELALMERAFEDSEPNDAFSLRKKILDRAMGHFSEASESIVSLFRRPNLDARRRQQLTILRTRAQQSVAYQPLMEVVAARYSGCELDKKLVQQRVQETKTNLLPMAESLLRRYNNHAVVGLTSETACGLVGNADEPRKYFIFPSSLRHDHHPRASARSNYIAATAEGKHRKVPVQVKTTRNLQGNETETTRLLVVRGLRDLVLTPGGKVDDTLRAFIDITEGRATPETEHRYAVLGRALTQRLDTLDAQRRVREAKLGHHDA